MFSQTVEYALRAAVLLAGEPETLQTTEQIAERTRVPRGYLSKVLQYLSRAGLVHAQRGLHGGFVLSRPPEEIAVIDVVNAVDPIQRIHECPLKLEAHGTHLCPLHRRLDDAMAMIEDVFTRTSLADLLTDPARGQALCELTVEKEPAGG